MAGLGIALRGLGKALDKAKKKVDNMSNKTAGTIGMVGTAGAIVGGGEALKRKKKKKKADEGLKKLKNIVPHVEYIRSKKKSK